jgi:hypothetical protein
VGGSLEFHFAVTFLLGHGVFGPGSLTRASET